VVFGWGERGEGDKKILGSGPTEDGVGQANFLEGKSSGGREIILPSSFQRDKSSYDRKGASEVEVQ